LSSTQTWDPELYERNARFVPEFGKGVVGLLAPQAGERILDLGCGDGELTASLTAFGCEVVGVDGSAAFIDKVRARGLSAYVMDGQDLQFDDEFDAVFSNAALHWMKRPEAVIVGVWRALRAGGRFIGEMGGAGNVSSIVAALEAALTRRGIDALPLNPWYFPSVTEYAARLEAAGFVVEHIELFDRPTRLPGHLRDWLDTFGEPFLGRLAPADRTAVMEEVSEALAAQMVGPDGVWTTDYVRLRFRARKPG
jgi:trans-aconitate methyltransferase